MLARTPQSNLQGIRRRFVAASRRFNQLRESEGDIEVSATAEPASPSHQPRLARVASGSDGGRSCGDVDSQRSVMDADANGADDAERDLQPNGGDGGGGADGAHEIVRVVEER